MNDSLKEAFLKKIDYIWSVILEHYSVVQIIIADTDAMSPVLLNALFVALIVAIVCLIIVNRSDKSDLYENSLYSCSLDKDNYNKLKKDIEARKNRIRIYLTVAIMIPIFAPIVIATEALTYFS